MILGQKIMTIEGNRAYDPAIIIKEERIEPTAGRFGSRPNKGNRLYTAQYEDGEKFTFKSTDIHKKIFEFDDENI